MNSKKKFSLFIALVLVFITVFSLPACGLPQGKRRFKSVEITNAPTKITYFEGETFDPEGMVVSAVYSDGTKEVLSAEDYNYDLKRPLTLEDTYVVILYKDKMTDVKINVVIDLAVSAVVKTEPVVKYAVGETFNPTGLVLTVTRQSGKTEDVAYTVGDERFEFDETPVNENTKYVSFTYDGVQITQNISIALSYTQFGAYIADCTENETTPNLSYEKILDYSKVYSAGGYTYGEIKGSTTDGNYIYAVVAGRSSERDAIARIFKIDKSNGLPLAFSDEFTANSTSDCIIYLKDGTLYTYVKEDSTVVVKKIALTSLSNQGGALEAATDAVEFKDGEGTVITPVDVSYNAAKETYAVLTTGKVYVFDKNGTYQKVLSVKGYGKIGNDNLWNTHMSTTEDYIYLSFHNIWLNKHYNNVMAIYDWDGNLVGETTFSQSVLPGQSYTKLLDSVVVGGEVYVFLVNPASSTNLQSGIYKAYTTDKYTK